MVYLGMGMFFLDSCLPFGLRSAPKIYTAFADAVTWVLFSWGIRYIIHYLDDFLLLGSPFTDEGRVYRNIAVQTFEELAIPVAYPKLEGPTPHICDLFRHPD